MHTTFRNLDLNCQFEAWKFEILVSWISSNIDNSLESTKSKCLAVKIEGVAPGQKAETVLRDCLIVEYKIVYVGFTNTNKGYTGIVHGQSLVFHAVLGPFCEGPKPPSGTYGVFYVQQ